MSIPPYPVRAMRLRNARPSQGVQWVRNGFRIFSRKPLAFSALFAAFMFISLVLLMVPTLGAVLMLGALPLVSLGFMIASQLALQDRTPTPTVFIRPLRRDPARTRSILMLGAVYALLSVLAMLLSDWVDGGSFARLQDTLAKGNDDPEALDALLNDGQLQAGLLLRLTLASLLSVPFWHAPAMVHWGGQGWVMSLFSSTLAVWRNRGAFSVYMLCWTGVVLAFGLVANIVFALLGAPELLAVVAMPAGLMFSTVFYASLFFTFADSFERAPASSAGDTQSLENL